MAAPAGGCAVPTAVPLLRGAAGRGCFAGHRLPGLRARRNAAAAHPTAPPEGEHSFYALSQAAAAYYYADTVRSAILRCKRGGSPWRTRELADRMAVLVFGALPARRVGGLPQYLGVAMLPLYNCIVPVPPRQPLPGVPGLPLLLARRLGQVLRIPVETPLSVRPGTRPQKELTRDERLQNARGAFVCQPGADLTGKRVLLVDDIITTGATASACALALLQAGATDVTVAAVAVAEELPKEKRKKTK